MALRRSEAPLRPAAWLWLAGTLLVAATLATLLAAGTQGPSRLRAGGRQEALETVSVRRADIVRSVEATGTFRPTSVVHVGALVSGVIASASVQAADRVEAGQVIATVEDGAFRQQLARAEAALAAARLRQAQARQSWQRQQSLAGQGFVAPSSLESFRTQAELAAQDVAVARTEVANARLDLAHCVVRAPIAGVVLSKDIAAGQSVASAFQVPDLFTIVSGLDPLEVVALFAESDLAWVAAGARVTMTVPAWPTRSFTATVRRILDTPENRQGVVMFPVLLSSPNADGALRPGMTAFVELRTVTRHAVPTLPNAAIAWARSHDRAEGLPSGGPPHVYASRQGQLVPLPVTPGEADDLNTEVLSSLDARERIVWKDRT